jgi:hypothetical protein
MTIQLVAMRLVKASIADSVAALDAETTAALHRPTGDPGSQHPPGDEDPEAHPAVVVSPRVDVVEVTHQTGGEH